MSSIRLKQDVEGKGKKGDVISVPFGVGKEMLAKGIGEYLRAGEPQPAKGPPKAEPVGARHDAEIRRLNAFHASEIQRVKDEAQAELQKQIRLAGEEEDSLRAELAAAQKTIAELQAKIKK